MNQSSVARGVQSKVSPNPQEKHYKVARPIPEQERYGRGRSSVLGGQDSSGRGYGGSSGGNESTDGFFTYPSYETKIIAHPTNQVVIRYQPIFREYRDNIRDKENKFKAKALENGVIINGQRCFLIAKDDSKKVKVSTKKDRTKLPRAKNYTKKNAIKVRRSAVASQKEFGKENSLFITLTVPGSTDAAMMMMAIYSDEIIDNLNKFVKARIGEDFKNRVGVWERQTRGALHTHTLYFSRNKEGMKRIQQDLKIWWYGYLLTLSEKTGVDMFERSYGGTWKDSPEVLRCEAKPIEYEASYYVSKYMSKEVSKDDDCLEDGTPAYYPHSWTTIGSGAKAILKKHTNELGRKRIMQDDAILLTGVCQFLTGEYSPEEYKKALVYKDLEGGGVNVQMIIKPEYMEVVKNHLRDFMESFDEVEYYGVDTRLIDYETASEIQDNRDYLDGWMQMIREKNRNADPRTWMKKYRKNPAPLPKFSSNQQWQEFYNDDRSRVCSKSSV